MTLENIYYIGQTVAVAAILGSLVYLAIQTRQNSKVMRATAVWDSQISFVAINEKLADGSIISEIGYRAITDTDSLTEYERYLAHRYFRAVLQRVEAQFALFQNGILDAEVWQLRKSYIKGLLANPIFGEVWRLDIKNAMFTKAFIAEIDNMRNKNMAGFLGEEHQESEIDLTAKSKTEEPHKRKPNA